MKRNFVRESDNELESTPISAEATLDAGTNRRCKIASRPIALIQVPTQRLFGVGGAARYLGISDDTLRKYADLGRIPVYRFINGHRAFKLEDLNRLIDSLPLWNDQASDTARAGRNGGIA